MCSVERFIDTESKLYTLLTNVRVIYDSKLKEPPFSLSSVSIGGTVSGTITEVCARLFCGGSENVYRYSSVVYTHHTSSVLIIL